MNIVIWIISGIIAGWLAGLVARGSGFGIIGDFIIGLIGDVLGGQLFGFLGVSRFSQSWIGEVLVAALGGVAQYWQWSSTRSEESDAVQGLAV